MMQLKGHFNELSSKRTLTVIVVLYCLLQCTPSASSLALESLGDFLAGTLTEPDVITIRDKANKSPIVFIPGDGASQLEAKLNKTKVPHYICRKVSDWFDIWLNLHLLVPKAIDCMFDNLKLHYDNRTRTTSNTEGVEIRPRNFGSLDSVDYLDVYHLHNTDYFHNIIATLEKNNGYIANVDMVAAPFDFRKAPNELADFFDELKKLIEHQYVVNNYQAITLICHSMGCLNSLYLLNYQKESWKKIYIRRLISLAAPWNGSFKAISAMLYGDSLGIPLLNKQKLQHLQSTFPSLMYLFPREPAFSKTRILVETPTRNYSLENLDELFVEAKMLDQLEIWHDSRSIANNLKAPNVEFWCLYGTGYETPSKLIYKDSLDKNNYLEIKGEGDKTVNLESLEACEHFATQQKEPVYTKMFRNVDHIGILRGQKPANFISNYIIAKDS